MLPTLVLLNKDPASSAATKSIIYDHVQLHTLRQNAGKPLTHKVRPRIAQEQHDETEVDRHLEIVSPAKIGQVLDFDWWRPMHGHELGLVHARRKLVRSTEEAGNGHLASQYDIFYAVQSSCPQATTPQSMISVVAQQTPRGSNE
jgi:hypothetical protein